MNRRAQFAERIVDAQGRAVNPFFGKQFIASNMHFARFTYKGLDCNYVEEPYQAEQAEALGDHETAARIREKRPNGSSVMTPFQMKKAAQESKKAAARNNPRALKKWHEEKGEHMRPMVFCKYDQNRHMQEALLATGDEEIFEATNRDHYWACGVNLGGTVAQFLASISDPDYHNMMGVLTMWVRSRMRLRLVGGVTLNPANRLVTSFLLI
jgi:ribA/ribD-fused uncharacterized protein